MRLTGCDLRCTYCDTEYAFYEGKRRTLDDIIAEVRRIRAGWWRSPAASRCCRSACTADVAAVRRGYTVLIETSGAHDIAPVDPRVHRIMDLKSPGSGECARNRMENLPLLGVRDEVKFVIGSEEDYAWAKAQVLAGMPGLGGSRECDFIFAGVRQDARRWNSRRASWPMRCRACGCRCRCTS